MLSGIGNVEKVLHSQQVAPPDMALFRVTGVSSIQGYGLHYEKDVATKQKACMV